MSVLPDVLQPNLNVVFCGMAAGPTSARLGTYYAGPGNRFWLTLHEVGFTSYQIAPHEFRRLLDFGIGLTDLAKTVSGADSALTAAAFDVKGLVTSIERFAPRVVAFNGKRAAKELYGASVSYGRQEELLGQSVAYILPSTSGAARRYWDLAYWKALADHVALFKGQPGEGAASRLEPA